MISVLSDQGCNSSGCHGSPAGQNGFKLSLFGYDVAADHEMVVRKHEGRRVTSLDPEKSLSCASRSSIFLTVVVGC